MPELDLVMEKDGQLIGHVMYARAWIQADDGRRIPAVTFGPISIAPSCQGKGYGKALVDASLELARSLGAGVACIEGNPDFYGHSGFVAAKSLGIFPAGEEREAESPYFLAKELQKDFLKGVTGEYHTPAGYFVDEAEAERFDEKFPPKEKKRLPGQLV